MGSIKKPDWVDWVIRDIQAIPRSSSQPDALLVTPDELRIVIEARMSEEIINLRSGLERANTAIKQLQNKA